MPTYAEYWHRDEMARKKVAQDARDAERHRMFDLQAQDRTPKSARPQFAVVGEGTLAAQDAYQRGYAQIRWSD